MILLNIFFGKIFHIRKVSSAHFIISWLFFVSFPVQCPAQTHAIIYLYIYRQKMFISIILTVFFISLKRTYDNVLVFIVQINLPIINCKISPYTTNRMITSHFNNLILFYHIISKFISDIIIFYSIFFPTLMGLVVYIIIGFKFNSSSLNKFLYILSFARCTFSHYKYYFRHKICTSSYICKSISLILIFLSYLHDSLYSYHFLSTIYKFQLHM